MMTMLEHEIGKKAHYSHDANSAFGVPFDILGLKGIRGSKIKWLWLFVMAGIVTTVGSSEMHTDVLESPDDISRTVLPPTTWCVC